MSEELRELARRMDSEVFDRVLSSATREVLATLDRNTSVPGRAKTPKRKTGGEPSSSEKKRRMTTNKRPKHAKNKEAFKVSNVEDSLSFLAEDSCEELESIRVKCETKDRELSLKRSTLRELERIVHEEEDAELRDKVEERVKDLRNQVNMLEQQKEELVSSYFQQAFLSMQVADTYGSDNEADNSALRNKDDVNKENVCINQSAVSKEEEEDIPKQEGLQGKLKCHQIEQEPNVEAKNPTAESKAGAAEKDSEEARAYQRTSTLTSEDASDFELSTVMCTCKKTKCLKLYCECFRDNVYCGDLCECHECKNNEENRDSRLRAFRSILSRNTTRWSKTIFQTHGKDFLKLQASLNRRRGGKQRTELPKVAAEVLAANPTLRRFRKQDQALLERVSPMVPPSGVTVDKCKCQRSRCLKKYCVCFSLSRSCNAGCSCVDCRNVEGKKKGKEKKDDIDKTSSSPSKQPDKKEVKRGQKTQDVADAA